MHSHTPTEFVFGLSIIFVFEKRSAEVLWQFLTIHLFSSSLFLSRISHFPSSSSCSCQIWRWALLSVQQTKERWKKPTEHQEHMFCLRQTLCFFWLLTQYQAEKYFNMFGCLRVVHEVICRHICAHTPYPECITHRRSRLRNWINQLFWLGFGGWQSYYKKLQTSQEVDDVYRFISALGHIKWLWSTHSKFMLQLLRVDSADTSTFVTGKSATRGK